MDLGDLFGGDVVSDQVTTVVTAGPCGNAEINEGEDCDDGNLNDLDQLQLVP